MSRFLVRMPAGDVPALLAALRVALDGSGPAVLPVAAATPAGAPEAADTAEAIDLDAALVIETSGSTGAPKRVALSGDALLASAEASADAVGGRGQWLLCLPGHYVAGSNVLVRSIHAGTEPVVMPPGHFDAAVFAACARELSAPERYASLVPVQLARLVDAAEADSGIRTELRRFDALLIGGQALRPELRERAEALGVRLVRTYGSSETSGGCVYDGYPIGTTRARVADGLLELSGPTLAAGYLGDPERSAATFGTGPDGIRWYRTGDLGELAADGRVTVLGRADNVIISGGEKVLLDAVERHVKGLPGLADVVVVAAPSAEWGQVPVVVTTAADASLAGIRASAAAALGRAAQPARIVTVEAIPHLASGKPDRVALAVLASAHAE
ncbi:MAG TPA: AMP-binding protein [Gryllotalpicola sp.]